MNEIDPGGDVSPLVAAADLQFAILRFAKIMKIKRLQDHVAELGVADAHVAILHPRTHAFLRDHGVDLEVLADVAKHVEERQRRGPVCVVDQLCCILHSLKFHEAAKLNLDPFDVGLQQLVREELALGSLSAGIADRAGRPARNGDWMVPA